MDDDEEQMDDIITSQSIPQKNIDDNMEFEEVIKQVNDNIELFNKQASGGSSSVFNENQNEYIVREKSNNYDEDDQQNDDEEDEDDEDDDDDDDDDDEEEEEGVYIANNKYVVAYNEQTEGYDGQGEDYNDVQVEDYNENDDDDDYGERIDEFGNQGNVDYGGRTSEYVDRISEYDTRNSEYGGNTSEYGGGEYLGRTSEYGGQDEDVYETLSDFDEQPNEYDPHAEYREQQVGIQGQISEYTEPQNSYQEQKVNEFTEHDKGKNTQDDDVEPGQFNMDTFGQNIQDA